MISSTILLILFVYLGILFGFGLAGRRESRTVAGYFIAGKKLPYWVIAFSSNATGESAWLLLGLTGMGYLIGVHAFWVVLGEVLGVAVGWGLVARPFKQSTDRYHSITVPDYLEDRFHDYGHLLRVFSALIIFSMVTAYTAAQLTASGKAFQVFLGLDYRSGVVIGTAIVLFYTTVGGFQAVAYSDVLQGVLMLAGLICLPLVGIAATGGWLPMIEQLRHIDPNLLRPMGEFGFSAGGVISALSFLGIGLAFLGAPQLLLRFMAARSVDEIGKAGVIATVCIVIFDCGAVLSGMAGRVLFPGLADSESVLPRMASELFPDFFTGLFVVIVLAAIMSTVDSLLILVSSSVVRDLLQKTLSFDWPEARLSFFGKLATVVIGLAALVTALAEVRAVFWFVLFAWSGLASAFAPVILCSLFWKRTSRVGAAAGMAAGFLSAVVWVLYFKSHFFDLYEMIPGFLAGFLATILFSIWFPAPGRGDKC